MPDKSKENGFVPRNRMKQYFAELELEGIEIDLADFDVDYWDKVIDQMEKDGEDF